MDFELTEEQKKFRQEVCDFLDKEVTKELLEEAKLCMGHGPHSWDFMRKLGAKRWLAPQFPVEYGGLGLPRMYRYIVAEELDYRNVTLSFPGFGLMGVDYAGPIILRFASEELKREFLPGFARGEIDVALGYTEPNAGSDLSRIAIRAVQDGDYFIITGQKTFNTGCHFAQYHWLAARTDSDAPLHKGLSMFLVDLKTPGITINPLWEMSDYRTNEVFYDEVRVPKRYLVGEKNQGWYYMASALDFERMITVGNSERVFEELIAYVKKAVKNGAPLSKDPLVLKELADIAIEINVARNLARRLIWLQDEGKPVTCESAIVKAFCTELNQRISKAGLEILGPCGLLRKHSKYSILEGMMELHFRASFMPTIGAGSSEIMRNIIALRGLGLPR